eukprot:snap_masked-scaffold844_size89433-processed-gene-0.9 protein:Tk06506 transcript:snap_masked-scaffold844_size89433-processed-gene-0.9-mRNA-1 annotation:"gastrula zinc finger"
MNTRAGLSSLNELTVHAVAMETWRAFHSQDGPDGSRNALGQVLFPSNVATRSTSLSEAAGVVSPHLPYAANTLVDNGIAMWNKFPALREASTKWMALNSFADFGSIPTIPMSLDFNEAFVQFQKENHLPDVGADGDDFLTVSINDIESALFKPTRVVPPLFHISHLPETNADAPEFGSEAPDLISLAMEQAQIQADYRDTNPSGGANEHTLAEISHESRNHPSSLIPTRRVSKKSRLQDQGDSAPKKVKLIITTKQDEIEKMEQRALQAKARKKTKKKSSRPIRLAKGKTSLALDEDLVFDEGLADDASDQSETWETKRLRPRAPSTDHFDLLGTIEAPTEDGPVEKANPDQVRRRKPLKIRSLSDLEDEGSDADFVPDEEPDDPAEWDSASGDEDKEEEEDPDELEPIAMKSIAHESVEGLGDIESDSPHVNIEKFGSDPKGEPAVQFDDGELSGEFLEQYLVRAKDAKETDGVQNDGDEKTFGCPFCDYSGIKNNWLGHLKLRHKEQKLMYCALGQSCYMPFQSEEFLRRHAEAEHGEPIGNTCVTCGKSFKWPSSLRNHMQCHLKDGDEKKQQFVCPYCGKKFNTRTGYRSHEAIYHTKNLRHPCDWDGCNKKFYNASDLVIHKRTHTGELPFTCSFCGSGFVSKSRMMQHERQMHLGVEAADVECEICHHKMKRRNFGFHMKTHKGLTKAWCSVCGKEFPTQGAKRRHEKIHFQDKKHACKYCGKAFVQRTNMLSHERIHTGEKPYPCKWCDERFIQQTRRNQHQSTCRQKPHQLVLDQNMMIIPQ